MRSRNALITTLLCLTAALPALSQAQELEFDALSFYVAGDQPGFVTARDYAGNPLDINLDGSVDFVLSYRRSQLVSTFLSDGSYGYGETSHRIDGVRPFTVVAGDFNRDGFHDVVSANDQSDSLSLLNGAIDGFETSSEIPRDNTPRAIVAEDFDGDGWVDLAYVTFGAPLLIEVLANDAGSFGLDPVFVTLFTGNLGYLAASDMDNDGDPDLVVVSNADDIGILRNHGGFFFEFDNVVQPSFDVNPRTLATGDLNDDGYTDLAVGNYLGDVGVDGFYVLNDGSGNFQSNAAGKFEVDGRGESVVIEDFNLDGYADIALSVDGEEPRGITIFLNDGATNFGSDAVLSSGDRPRWLTSADIDGDGDVDLASANIDDGLIVYRNLLVETSSRVEVFLVADQRGAGRIDVEPARKACSTDDAVDALCTYYFAPGTEVTLTAVAAAGTTFLGWFGPCDGVDQVCQFTTDGGPLPTAGANFLGPPPLNVHVTSLEGGRGTVLVEPGGGSCESGGSCSFVFDAGTPVTLTAVPDPDSTFLGWGELCVGTAPTCETTWAADAPVTVYADFQGPRPFVLHVTSLEGGIGTVLVEPSGSCESGSSCNFEFVAGTTVRLTAGADPSSTFLGWGGPCLGVDPTCEFTLESDAPPPEVYADFQGPRPFVLHVASLEGGIGTVLVEPSGSCESGSSCNFEFVAGTTVRLTAGADPSSTFLGWGGPCVGADSICEFTLETDSIPLEVYADFQGPRPFVLHVTGLEGGIGTVLVEPSGSCESGSSCNFEFVAGTTVKLTAGADPSSTFLGWGGPCIGADLTCEFTLETDSIPLEVYADFLGPRLLALQLSSTESGMGTVLIEPGGDSCESESSCNFEFVAGTTVTLTAVPDASSTFNGWSGVCAGTAQTCQIALEAETFIVEVYADFLGPRLLFVEPKSIEGGSGSVLVDPPGEACDAGSYCRHAYPVDTVMTLTAQPAVDSIFSGWTGVCLGAGLTCQVTLTGELDTRVEAHFVGPRFLDIAIDSNRSGRGGVHVDPPGDVCENMTTPGLCTYSYRVGTVVTLTVQADTGSTFEGWEGACVGNAPTCQLTLTKDERQPIAVANFTGPRFLGIDVVGVDGGEGSVTAAPPGETCDNAGGPSVSCQYAYPLGAQVTLTAVPAPGDIFLGWSSACTGVVPVCELTITGDPYVMAKFARPQTVESRISDRFGDVEERSNGRIRSRSGDLDLDVRQTVGLRFQALGIPQGAIVMNAYVQFQADERDTGATDLFIAAHAHDNAPELRGRYTVTSREKTSEVSWSPLPWNTVGEAGPDQRTPDLAAIVQEVVGRAGWTSSSALVLILRGESSPQRAAESFDGNHPEGAPLIHIEYIVSGS